MKSTQRGFSLLGLIFVGGVLAFIGIIGAQVVPTVIEYQAIQKAATKSSDGNSVAEIRSIFDKAAAIDDISSISGKDLVLAKEGDKTVVSFSYNREIHLGGPAFLTIKYAGRSS
jgi:Tfp pilus assembly major pilin PilA